MRKQIPNLITLMNLACGTVAIVLTLEGQWQWAVYLILAASLFDFLDGFAARLLNAYSKTGKQLDSLADMVTFGVLPAVFIYTIFKSVSSGNGGGGTLYWIMLISVVIVPGRLGSRGAPGLRRAGWVGSLSSIRRPIPWPVERRRGPWQAGGAAPGVGRARPRPPAGVWRGGTRGPRGTRCGPCRR